MPLHRIYHAVDAFSATDKKQIAERITAIYTAVGLPGFYVNVLFVPLECLFVGGEARLNFVRIVTQHLAIHAPPERKTATAKAIEEAMKPFVKDRGYDWELHIEDTPREGWSMNGFAPPLVGEPGLKLWAEKNRPVPY
ncbi:hypothetical protein SpCBS45565_g07670 [Spizellomyces sp. 'palustris']|nr:hypothetical protein SpCBS45565_g07670 [Spizellomyces sp. 'palustris']